MIETLKKCIEEIKIPGVCELYKIKDCYIVIDAHIAKILKTLKGLQEDKKINKIKVVVGSMGYGYKNWEERLKTTEFKESRANVRKYAMNLLKDNVDFVYLTESDNAAETVLSICQELQENLGEVPSVIIEDRAEAIRQAIKESVAGDAILIAGRGNRRVSCNSESTIKLIKDSEIVEQILKEIN